VNQGLSPTEIAALVTRGATFISDGDIASVRLLYERAAEAGDASAALRLRPTFDPGFLAPAGFHSLFSDAGQAASWYRRAHALGDTAAAERLKLSTSSASSSRTRLPKSQHTAPCSPRPQISFKASGRSPEQTPLADEQFF